MWYARATPNLAEWLINPDIPAKRSTGLSPATPVGDERREAT
jgi:hypothetical protein